MLSNCLFFPTTKLFHFMFFITYTLHSSIISKKCPLLSPQCLFLIWCMAPVTWNGSDMLYKRVIRPFFLKHQAAMDSMVSDLTSKAKNITETVTKEGETTTVYMQVQPLQFTVCTAATYSHSRPTSVSPHIGPGDIT